MHRSAVLILFIVLAMTGCRPKSPVVSFLPATLSEARAGFQTRLMRRETDGTPVSPPPAGSFRLVKYPSPVGELSAYLGAPPPGRSKSPALIWLVGGFSNSIGEVAWKPGLRGNDQSASAFREAGIITMYPSLRGGNDNPGVKEGFYGEVDDVLAAADYLAGVESVDPQRIYLGGHSTGGSLALLVAETGTHRFRAIFSFGPVIDVAEYGADSLPFSVNSRLERKMRSPGMWLSAITTPTFVIEGADGKSNIADLQRMERLAHSQDVSFYAVAAADHFSLLAPITHLLAEKIKDDGDASPRFNLLSAEIAGAMRK